MSQKYHVMITPQRRLEQQPRGLYVTGETTSFVSRDDGAFQAGYIQANRFEIKGIEVFYDRVSGLYWARDRSSAGQGNMNTFNAAFVIATDANSAILGGYDDWRVPNISELFSLVEYGQAGSGDYSWADAPWTVARPDDFVWSSTTVERASTQAWTVGFEFGNVLPKLKTNLDAKAIVCRGGIL